MSRENWRVFERHIPLIVVKKSKNFYIHIRREAWRKIQPSGIIAIYSTAIKSVLFHEKTRDILFLERPQLPYLCYIKFTLFHSSKGEIKWNFLHASRYMWIKNFFTFLTLSKVYTFDSVKKSKNFFIHIEREAWRKFLPSGIKKFLLFLTLW